MAGPMSVINIECGVPGLAGSTIDITAVPKGQEGTGVQATIWIGDGNVTINVGSGGGTTLRFRQFKGNGTTGFDAAKGTHLSGPVSETTDATVNKGTIGAVSAISGTVSCGNQTAGTSTVTVSGTSSDGPFELSTANFRVACTTGSSGSFVGIQGVSTVNGVRTLWFVTIGDGSLQIAQEPETGTAHFFLGQNQIGSVVTPNGGQVDSDATQEGQSGGAQFTAHAKGSATCGSTGPYGS